jgi:hypothetical protein
MRGVFVVMYIAHSLSKRRRERERKRQGREVNPTSLLLLLPHHDDGVLWH